MSVGLVLATVLAAGCGATDDPNAPKASMLDSLVAQRASWADVAKALPGAYTWYAPGTNAWEGLLDSVRRGGPDYMPPVQVAVRNTRKIMFHTTMWQQTWIFLDDAERIESYWITAQ
jgi:hypothetical protein